MPDETVYIELARGLAHHGRLEILGHQVAFYSLWYPLFLSPFASLGDTIVSIDLAGVAQALAMCCAAIPVWLWGRRFLPPGYARAAAALTILTPEFAYARLTLTEALYYPLLMVTLWVTAEVIRQPTRGRQLALLCLMAVTATTRMQGLVLLLVVPTALAYNAIADRERRRLHDLALLGLGAVVAAAAVLALVAVTGPRELLGSYASTAGRYGLGPSLSYLGVDAAGLSIMVGFIPALALLVLIVESRGAWRGDRAVRAFVSVALASVFWGLLETAVFSSRFATGRMMGRYLFELSPVLFLAAARAAASRPSRRVVAGCAAVLLVLLLALPTEILGGTGTWDAPSLALWSTVHGFAAPRWTVFALGALVYAFVLAAPRRPSSWIGLSAGLLVGGSVLANVALARADRADVARTVGPDTTWIDDAAGGSRVAFVYTGDVWAESVGRSLFWNAGIRSVSTLGTTLPGPIPASKLTIDSAGHVNGLAPGTKIIVSSTALTWRGARLRTVMGAPHLVLWRLAQRPSISSWVEGLNEASQLYDAALVRVFGHRKATISLRLTAGAAAAQVTTQVFGGHARTIGIAAGATLRASIPVPDGLSRGAAVHVSTPVQAIIRVTPTASR